MKEFKIELLSENSAVVRIEAYEKLCRYLLQIYLGGCEEFECFGIFEGINGGTGRKGLFDTGTEDRGSE